MAGKVTIISDEEILIELVAGDTLGPFTMQYFTSVAGIETAIDITGDTFEMNVVTRKGAPPVLTFIVGAGFTIQNTNELVMSKSANFTDIEPRRYTSQIERTSGGIVSTEMTVTFDIKEDTT